MDFVRSKYGKNVTAKKWEKKCSTGRGSFGPEVTSYKIHTLPLEASEPVSQPVTQLA